MQRRIYNYGDGFTQQAHILSLLGLNRAGVYTGLEVRVTSSDGYSITPGTVLMPDGVLILEDTEFPMDPIRPLPSLATTYTLKVRHEDVQIFGGQAATYVLVPSYSPASSTEIILGYIQYPGGGAPLSSSTWVPTERLRPDIYADTLIAQAPIEILPPYTGLVQLGAFTTRSAVLSGSSVFDRFTADGATPGPAGDDTTFIFPQIARTMRPRRVEFTHLLPVTSKITVSVCDTAGTVASIAVATGTGLLTGSGVSVPNTLVFAQGSPYYIKFVLNMQALDVTDLGLVKVIFNPLT